MSDSRALTGLRGAAALLVVLHHLYLRQQLHLPVLNGLAMKFYLAVDLFFVLSGFVMALAYGAWFRSGFAAGPYAVFLLRRVARLWPLHVALVLAVLAIQWHEGAWVAWPKMIVANLLMIQSWGVSQVINPPSWSVSTEMLAYVAFPVLAAVALHRGRGMAWAALLVAGAALVLCVWLAPDRGAGRRGPLDIYDNWSLLPALRCLAGFTIGLLTYRSLDSVRWRMFLQRPGVGAAVAGSLLVAMAVEVPDLAVYAGLPVLVASTHLGRDAFQRTLAAPAFHGLGVLSYAIYLVHVPVLDRLPHLIGSDPAVLVPATLALTFGLAWLGHRLIELPVRRLVRSPRRPWRILRRRQSSPI